MELIGQRFNIKHAAGVTRYQVDRRHRDAGYFECVAIRGVSGTHHFIGSIQVMSAVDIRQALSAESDPYDARESFDRIRRTRAAHQIGCCCADCECQREADTWDPRMGVR